MRQTLRQIVAVLALGGIAMSLVPNALAASFTDLSAANKLASDGIIVDKSANSADYRLGDTLLRQEGVGVAAKALGIIPDAPVADYKCEGKFSDISEAWVCRAAELAAKAGLTDATKTTFRPKDNLSKYEAMLFALKSSCADISDRSVAGVAKYAADAGIITNAASFNGVAAATRGEFFRYVATAMEDSACGDEDVCTLFPDLCGDDTDPTDPTPSTGDVEVTLNSDSPESRTVPNSGLVPFGKFDVTAGPEDATLSSLTLKREGLSNRSDIQRVYFEMDGVRVSNRANITVDDTAVMSFSPALKIDAGETITLDLIVELKTGGATVGAEHKFSIEGYDVETALMKLGSYTVETVDIDAVSAGTTNVNVGDTEVLLGEFRLNTTGDKDNVFKSITLRNDGTADVAASLDNLALYNDGKEVSTNVQVNGRDVTFTVDADIENGSSENYEIRADIIGAERSPETYMFKVRNATDITVSEKITGFSAPIVTTLPSTFASLSLGTISAAGGDTLLSRDTAYTSSQTVSPNTANVVLWAGKLTVKEAVEFEDVSVAMNLTTADLNQISSMRFIVDGSTVASYSPSSTSATGAQTVLFDAQFTVSKNSTMRIEANLRNTATGNINVTGVTLGSTDARYTSNDEVATVSGSANGISTDVSNATLSVTQNDGIDNFTLVSGAKNVTVLGFALRANDISDVKITAISPTKGGTVAMTNVSNVRLYKGDTLVSTKNNFDFNNLNITIPKNTSVSYKIVADFNTSVAGAETLTLSLAAGQITARDVSSNATISATGTAAISFLFATSGTLTASVNSSQANATIVTPTDSEVSVFKFDVEAKNDKSRVTDVYIKNTGGVDLAQALRSASLTLGTQTAQAVIMDANTLQFSFGSQGVVIDRDQKLTADLKVAFFDSNTRTDLGFVFSLPTGAVAGQVTGTLNGMRVVSDSTGNTLTRGGGVVSSNSHLLARSKPTVAMTAFTSSVNDLYKFSVTADANRKIKLEGLDFGISGSANLAGRTITVYRDSESAGNVVFSSADTQALAVATPTAAGVAVAQTSTLTPANVEVGDVFTTVINGTTVSYTATVATVANVTAGLTAAINASAQAATVTAVDGGTNVVVTADAVNTVFTITSSTTTNPALLAGIGNREVSGTVQFIVKITGVAAVNTDLTREVRVSQLTYSDDVTTPANINVAAYNVGVPTSTASYKY